MVSDAVRAGAVAAVLSGVPSTAWALVRGTDPLAPSLAAGAMLLPNASGRSAMLGAAAVVHATLSLGWAHILAAGARAPTTTQGLLRGAAAGLAIAAVDLALAHAVRSPRLERVRALPVLPQVADHVVYGALVGGLLPRRERRERRALT